MKKIPILLFLTLSLLFSRANAQLLNKIKTDWQEDGLKGKVKQVKESSFEPVKKSGKIVPGKEGGSGGYPLLEKYGITGYKIERIVYYIGDSLMRRHIYHYDEKDHLIQVDNYNSDNIFEDIQKYFYDENGQLSQTGCCYDSTDQVTGEHYYKYDQNANLIEDDYYFSNGTHVFRLEYKYDSNNNLIEQNAYNPDSSLMTRYRYKYDENGLKIEQNIWQPERNMNDTYTYQYDKKGNMVKQSALTGGNKLISTYCYKYKYDRKKNWIQRIAFLENTPLAITLREIEYF